MSDRYLHAADWRRKKLFEGKKYEDPLDIFFDIADVTLCGRSDHELTVAILPSLDTEAGVNCPDCVAILKTNPFPRPWEDPIQNVAPSDTPSPDGL